MIKKIFIILTLQIFLFASYSSYALAPSSKVEEVGKELKQQSFINSVAHRVVTKSISTPVGLSEQKQDKSAINKDRYKFIAIAIIICFVLGAVAGILIGVFSGALWWIGLIVGFVIAISGSGISSYVIFKKQEVQVTTDAAHPRNDEQDIASLRGVQPLTSGETTRQSQESQEQTQSPIQRQPPVSPLSGEKVSVPSIQIEVVSNVAAHPDFKNIKKQITEINQKAQSSDYEGDWSKKTEYVLNSERSLYLAKNEKGEIVGYASVQEDNYVAYLAIRDGYRGKGIGKFLLKKIIKERGFITLHRQKTNKAGKRLYDSFRQEGYEVEKQKLPEYYHYDGAVKAEAGILYKIRYKNPNERPLYLNLPENFTKAQLENFLQPDQMEILEKTFNQESLNEPPKLYKINLNDYEFFLMGNTHFRSAKGFLDSNFIKEINSCSMMILERTQEEMDKFKKARARLVFSDNRLSKIYQVYHQMAKIFSNSQEFTRIDDCLDKIAQHKPGGQFSLDVCETDEEYREFFKYSDMLGEIIIKNFDFIWNKHKMSKKERNSISEELERAKKETEEYTIKKRNIKWMNKIQKLIQLAKSKNQKIFIAVGASHLTDKDSGLLKMFREQGATITEVKPEVSNSILFPCQSNISSLALNSETGVVRDKSLPDYGKVESVLDKFKAMLNNPQRIRDPQYERYIDRIKEKFGNNLENLEIAISSTVPGFAQVQDREDGKSVLYFNEKMLSELGEDSDILILQHVFHELGEHANVVRLAHISDQAIRELMSSPVETWTDVQKEIWEEYVSLRANQETEAISIELTLLFYFEQNIRQTFGISDVSLLEKLQRAHEYMRQLVVFDPYAEILDRISKDSSIAKRVADVQESIHGSIRLALNA